MTPFLYNRETFCASSCDCFGSRKKLKVNMRKIFEMFNLSDAVMEVDVANVFLKFYLRSTDISFSAIIF